ncbi:hypothetical protein N431DRAFT_504489 [Stipitochalara longipes BDJ]|nr:hypothetical protein N431DRAFT_504489 [Stipitochalara longipes BDJ]
MATIAPSAKRKRPASSVLDWTTHRAEIERLYLKEDKGLPTVMTFMRREHNFEASKAQYEAQFRHWGFRKNWSKEHWRYAYFKSKDRQNAGKESMINLDRTLISQEKAKKEFRRHVTVTEQCIPSKIFQSNWFRV